MAFRARADAGVSSNRHHQPYRGTQVNTTVAKDPSETPTTEGHIGWRSRFFSPNNRYLPPLFITCILLAGQLEFGILESWGRTLLAIATSMAMEIVLARLMIGKWP